MFQGEASFTERERTQLTYVANLAVTATGVLRAVLHVDQAGVGRPNWRPCFPAFRPLRFVLNYPSPRQNQDPLSNG